MSASFWLFRNPSFSDLAMVSHCWLSYMALTLSLMACACTASGSFAAQLKRDATDVAKCVLKEKQACKTSILAAFLKSVSLRLNLVGPVRMASSLASHDVAAITVLIVAALSFVTSLLDEATPNTSINPTS